MKHFNRRYFIDNSGESISHSANKKHAEYGTKNSVSSDRGTDGKKNNTSEYNHEYYEENKEKWSNKKNSSKSSTRSHNDDLYYDKDGNARFGHKDYDENDEDFKRTDGKKIEGTNLTTFTNKNGSTIILGNGIKFSFPPGTKITSAMAKQIARIEGGDKSNKESYVAKMLNAVTGFADKQGLNTDTAGKKSSSSSSKKKSESSDTKSSSETEKKQTSNWDKIMNKYSDKEEAPKKTVKEVVNDAQTKGKSMTEYYKKQQEEQKKKKQTKQSSQYVKHSDLDEYENIGQIPVKYILGGN